MDYYSRMHIGDSVPTREGKSNKKYQTQVLTRFIFLAIFGLFFLNSHGNASADKDFEIKLRWQPVEGIKRYRIQISRTKNFEKIAHEGVSQVSEWVFHPDSGDYGAKIFYRVASEDSSGQVGEYSSSQILEIPVPESAHEAVHVEEVRGNTKGRWSSLLQIGLGGLYQQSNEIDLKSVSVPFSTPQTRISMLYERVLEESGYRLWSVQLYYQYQMFQSVSSPRVFDQPRIPVSQFGAELLKWEKKNKWAYGLSFESGFRWVKTGTESVTNQNGISFGPSIAFSFFSSPVLMGRLAIPFSGYFTNTQIGGNLALWTEWGILKNLASRLQTELSYEFWSTPARTTLFSWSVWGSAVIKFF